MKRLTSQLESCAKNNPLSGVLVNKISWKAALQYEQLIFWAIIAMDLMIFLSVCHLLGENLFSAVLLHLCIFFFHDTNGLNDLFISPLIFWDGQGAFLVSLDRGSIELPQQKASGGWEPMRVPTMWALRGACCSYPRTRGPLLKRNQLRAFTTSDLSQWDLILQVTFLFGHF